MSGEGRKTLSIEETDRLNAALAMSALASGLSPVKIKPEDLNEPCSTSCSQQSPDRGLPVSQSQTSCNMEEASALQRGKPQQLKCGITTPTMDAQIEPLDLSSPNVVKKFSRGYDSGNESNNSPEPELSATEERTKFQYSNTHTIVTSPKSHPQVDKSHVKFTQTNVKQGITRPDTLSGLKPVIQYSTSVSPVKSESELDSPASSAASNFINWTMPYKPSHPRPSSSDCHSYSSSTSGYSSESFSEARSESEIESPGPNRLKSHLPPKKRKHIRHARHWEVETKKKSSPTPCPSTSTTNDDDEVFTPSESPVKKETNPRQIKTLRPNSRVHGEKTIRINPKLVQEIKLAVTPDEEGDLPLHIAVVQENKDVISRVIPLMKVAGLSIDTPNALQQTPLHLAVITGEAEIVAYLIRQGAAPDFSDREGNTCLHLAVKHKQLECLKAMLQDTSKFDINGKNFEGMTPLHVAVQEKSLDITICLLDRGADIDCQDGKSGRTALHHAVEATCSPLVGELLKRNANVNQPSYSGSSPLHVASGRGHLDIVQLLVQYGADTTMRNFTVSIDNHQAAVQGGQGSSGAAKNPPGGQKRNQKASVKRKLREKLNT